MNRFSVFKITFLAVSAGLFAGILVYGLFEVDFSDMEALKKLLLKSFVTAVVTGLVLALINSAFKLFNFQNKNDLPR